MKIAIVLEATLGGIRKHVVDLVEYLSAQGHAVYFIYSTQRADNKFMLDVKRLKASRIHCVELPMTKSVYRPANLRCVWKMRTLFKTKGIEVVHLHGAVAGALGRLAAKGCKRIRRIFYSPHGGVLHKASQGLSGKIYVLIEKSLRSKKVFFVAVSSDEKEKLKAVLNLPSSKIALVPNGIDVQELKQQAVSASRLQQERKKLQLGEDDFVLLYPALFLEAKGHLNFFQTFIDNKLALLPNVKILLAGHGPLQPAVQALVNGLPFRRQVHFLGFVSDIVPCFQLADAVLLPSVNEAFGYVLLEAMVFGKPVFATSVGGIKDLVERGKNGFLYDPANLSLLINDLNRFAQNPGALGAVGKNSVEDVVRKFSLGVTLGRMATLYTT